MKTSDLIEKLSESLRMNGDLEVYYEKDSDGTCSPAECEGEEFVEILYVNINLPYKNSSIVAVG